jgi:hypothetical protein
MASRMAVMANEGADIAGEPIIMSQLAINGHSHEGVDIAGERNNLLSSSRFTVAATRALTSQASE